MVFSWMTDTRKSLLRDNRWLSMIFCQLILCGIYTHQDDLHEQNQNLELFPLHLNPNLVHAFYLE